MPQIAKLVRLKVAEGQREQLVAALAPVRELAAGDPGTEVWTIHADDASPDDLFIYELYRDQAAADAHDESPVLKSALQSTAVFMAGPPEFIHGEVLTSSAP
jgi:quinol monooxygenase YgiN